MLINEIETLLETELPSALKIATLNGRQAPGACQSLQYMAEVLERTPAQVRDAIIRILSKKKDCKLDFAQNSASEDGMEVNVGIINGVGSCRLYARYSLGQLMLTTIHPPQIRT